MKKLSKTLCILTSLALSAGCINEDMSDCPPPFNAELTFSYAGDRQEPEMFSRMIDGVTLVVFDRASGRHILDKKVVKADLNRFPGTQTCLRAITESSAGAMLSTIRNCFSAALPKDAYMRRPTAAEAGLPQTTISTTEITI